MVLLPSVFPENHRSRKRWVVCFIRSISACFALSAVIRSFPLGRDRSRSAVIVPCSGLGLDAPHVWG